VRPNKKFIWTCACLLVAWVAPANAGTTQAAFTVRINLNNPLIPGNTSSTGYCISQTLSKATNAIVRVVCGSNQFVSIEPQVGTAFPATHGGAYRFLFEPTSLMSSDDPMQYMGAGTITSLHVYRENDQEDTIEMLVSF
jgi:hypothetical protein